MKATYFNKNLSQTNDNYWDCECEDHYIHSKEFNYCPRCQSNSDEQPDSIEREIKYNYNPAEDGAIMK